MRQARILLLSSLKETVALRIQGCSDYCDLVHFLQHLLLLNVLSICLFVYLLSTCVLGRLNSFESLSSVFMFQACVYLKPLINILIQKNTKDFFAFKLNNFWKVQRLQVCANGIVGRSSNSLVGEGTKIKIANRKISKKPCKRKVWSTDKQTFLKPNIWTTTTLTVMLSIRKKHKSFLLKRT